MEPIRTDFRGYEGMHVAMDARTGKIVIADKNPRVVLEKGQERNHVVVGGRVPVSGRAFLRIRLPWLSKSGFRPLGMLNWLQPPWVIADVRGDVAVGSGT
jgi:hypothetical protein